MTTDTPGLNERIATRRLLGIDTAGRHHRWDMVKRTLYVLDADETEVLHATHLGDRSLGDWVEFVTRECGGWARLHYSKTPFGGIQQVAGEGEEAI